MLAPFDGQALRQVRNRSFGHAINAFRGKRDKSRLRTHVDDAPIFLADHDPSRGLAREKRTLQIDRERCIEIFFTDILGQILRRNSRVVHQNVELAELGASALNC